MGVTKAQAEFGAIVAVLYKVGQAMVEAGKKAQQFSEQFDALTQSQREAVMEADQATKGLIKTTDLMTVQAKANAAGLQLSGQQLSALGKIAWSVAEATGEGPQGATTRLNGMIDSIVKGNDRGLKPYGVSLANVTGLTNKQASALDQLTAASERFTVKADDLDDQFESLGNRMDAFWGLEWDWLKKLDLFGVSINGISDSIGKWNKMVVDSGGKVLDYANSWEYLGDRITGLVRITDAGFFNLRAWEGEWDRIMGKVGAAYQQGKAEMDAKKAAEDAKSAADRLHAAANSGEKPLFDRMMESGWSYEANNKRGSGGGGGARGPKKGSTEDLIAQYGVGRASDTGWLGGFGSEEDMAAALNWAAEEARAQFAINEELARQVEYLREINGAENERMALLQAKRDIAVTEMTTEEKHELWMMEEEHQQRMIAYEAERAAFLHKESTFYEDLMETGRQFGKEDQFRKSIMTKSWGTLSGAAGVYMKAIWSGSESAGKAVRRMIHDTLEGYSIEYGVKALVEAAEAIIAAASYRYDAAAKHAAAAATCLAVSAAAGSAAMLMGIGLSGGGGVRGGAPMSAGAAASGGGGGYSGYAGDYAQKSNEPTEIVIHVDGTLASLFNQLTVEAKRQKKSGAYQGGW